MIVKINQLVIYGFGKFHDVSLNLNQDFQLLYGPNEAGKSTLVEFITSMLFGFLTAKQRYRMYKPKDGATYGGELTFDHDGSTFWLKRVSGKNGGDVTFRNVTTDTDLTREDLEALLRPVNRDLFRAIFCFDETDLAAVVNLDRFELTNRIQRIGAVGSDNWIKLNKKLHKTADEIFKLRGRVQPLAKALTAHEALEQRIVAAKKAYPRYLELTETQAANEASMGAADKTVAQKLNEVNTLGRLEQVYDGYLSYREFQADNSAETAMLPAADWQTYTTLTTAEKQLSTQLQQTQQDLAEQRQANQPSTLQAFYLDHQQTIDDLTAQLDAYSQALASQTQIQSQLAQDQTQLNQLVAKYGEAQPLSAEDEPIVRQLLDDEQTVSVQLAENARQQASMASDLVETESPKPNQEVSIKWLVAGILIVGLSIFFLDGIFKTVGGLVGVVAAGYGIFRPHLSGRTSGQSEKAYLQRQQADLKEQAAGLTTKQTTLNEQEKAIAERYHLQQLTAGEWLTSQADLRQKAQLATTIQSSEKQASELQQQVATHSAQWSFAVDTLKLSDAPQERLNQLRSFTNARIDESQRLRLANDAIQKTDRQVAELTQQLAERRSALATFLSDRHLADAAAFETAYEASQRFQQQQNEMKAIKNQLSEQDLATLNTFKDKPALTAAKELAQRDYDDARHHQQELVQQQTAVTYEMTQIQESGDYQQLLQDKAVMEAEITDMADEWLANEVLIQWIDQTLVNASKGRQPQILESATAYFNTLTDGHYTKLQFTDETVEVERNDGVAFDVGELSRGTAEQLYVALRFAFTQVMAEEVQFPVIIDDSFVNFDRGRIKNAFKLLEQLQTTTQILYFTADETNRSLVDDNHCLDLATAVQ